MDGDAHIVRRPCSEMKSDPRSGLLLKLLSFISGFSKKLPRKVLRPKSAMSSLASQFLAVGCIIKALLMLNLCCNFTIQNLIENFAIVIILTFVEAKMVKWLRKQAK